MFYHFIKNWDAGFKLWNRREHVDHKEDHEFFARLSNQMTVLKLQPQRVSDNFKDVWNYALSSPSRTTLRSGQHTDNVVDDIEFVFPRDNDIPTQLTVTITVDGLPVDLICDPEDFRKNASLRKALLDIAAGKESALFAQYYLQLKSDKKKITQNTFVQLLQWLFTQAPKAGEKNEVNNIQLLEYSREHIEMHASCYDLSSLQPNHPVDPQKELALIQQLKTLQFENATAVPPTVASPRTAGSVAAAAPPTLIKLPNFIEKEPCTIDSLPRILRAAEEKYPFQISNIGSFKNLTEQQQISFTHQNETMNTTVQELYNEIVKQYYILRGGEKKDRGWFMNKVLSDYIADELEARNKDGTARYATTAEKLTALMQHAKKGNKIFGQHRRSYLALRNALNQLAQVQQTAVPQKSSLTVQKRKNAAEEAATCYQQRAKERETRTSTLKEAFGAITTNSATTEQALMIMNASLEELGRVMGKQLSAAVITEPKTTTQDPCIEKQLFIAALINHKEFGLANHMLVALDLASSSSPLSSSAAATSVPIGSAVIEAIENLLSSKDTKQQLLFIQSPLAKNTALPESLIKKLADIEKSWDASMGYTQTLVSIADNFTTVPYAFLETLGKMMNSQLPLCWVNKNQSCAEFKASLPRDTEAFKAFCAILPDDKEKYLGKINKEKISRYLDVVLDADAAKKAIHTATAEIFEYKPLQWAIDPEAKKLKLVVESGMPDTAKAYKHTGFLGMTRIAKCEGFSSEENVNYIKYKRAFTLQNRLDTLNKCSPLELLDQFTQIKKFLQNVLDEMKTLHEGAGKFSSIIQTALIKVQDAERVWRAKIALTIHGKTLPPIVESQRTLSTHMGPHF